jgi:hypothetical protein
VVEFPLESVDAVVVTVTTLKTYAGVATGVGVGVGVVTGAVTAAALKRIEARPNRPTVESTDALLNEAVEAVGVAVAVLVAVGVGATGKSAESIVTSRTPKELTVPMLWVLNEVADFNFA